MKYHAVLTANQGLNTPPTNPCQLLDFALLKLAAGETHSAESGEREILAVILGGKATFVINGQRFEKVLSAMHGRVLARAQLGSRIFKGCGRGPMQPRGS